MESSLKINRRYLYIVDQNWSPIFSLSWINKKNDIKKMKFLNYYNFIVYPLVSASPHIFQIRKSKFICSRYPSSKLKRENDTSSILSLILEFFRALLLFPILSHILNDDEENNPLFPTPHIPQPDSAPPTHYSYPSPYLSTPTLPHPFLT
jgi:hypothetical protein